MMVRIVFFVLILFINEGVYSQKVKGNFKPTHNPINKVLGSPEQDCNFAIPVCQETYTQPNSYKGFGDLQEIPENSSCLEVRERNTVWYIMTIQAGGDLGFQLTPTGDARNRDTTDYDFAVYNITNRSCSDIKEDKIRPLRCNFSPVGGVTGLSNRGTNASENGRSRTNTQCTLLPVQTGETYVLVIDNYSENQSGYVLDFRNGSATLFDTEPPKLRDVLAPCLATTFTIQLTESALCSSIASDGTDFVLRGPGGNVPIRSARGRNCGKFTSQIEITINSSLQLSGNYTVEVVRGSDGNTLIDNCVNEMPLGQTWDFMNDLPRVKLSIFPDTICEGQTVRAEVEVINGGIWEYQFVIDGVNLGTGRVHTLTPKRSGMIKVELISPKQVGCVTPMDEVPVVVYPLPSINYSITPNLPAEIVISDKPKIQFSTIVDSGNTCEWDLGNGRIVNECSGSEEYNSVGNYQIRVKVRTPQGCEVQEDIGLFSVSKGKVYIPNAFSPNGDDVNDGFKVIVKGFEKYHLVIFDPWGNEIFTNRLQNGIFWNGKIKGTGKFATEGVYSYVLWTYFEGEKQEPIVGTITVIR